MSTHKRLSFTKTEERLLIAFVRDHPALWDTSSMEYGNSNLRKHYWKTISNQLQKSAEQCNRKWRFLRNYYINKRKRDSSAIEIIDSKYTMLNFLDKVMEQRDKIKDNLDSKSSELSTEKNSLENIWDKFLEYMSDTQTDESILNEFKFKNNLEFEQLKKNSLTKEQIENMKCSILLKDEGYELKLYKLDISAQEKSIDVFFESMAATVKTFPPEVVAKAKTRVLNAINELELQIHEQC